MSTPVAAPPAAWGIREDVQDLWMLDTDDQVGDAAPVGPGGDTPGTVRDVVREAVSGDAGASRHPVPGAPEYIVLVLIESEGPIVVQV